MSKFKHIKSGTKFRKNGITWTLQKLPDFEMWVLVTDEIKRPDNEVEYWCGPKATIQAAIAGFVIGCQYISFDGVSWVTI